MNITRAAIEKSRVTVVTLVLIVIGGFIAFSEMSRAEDPGFTIRVATVATYFPGASPERMEHLVTDKLEKALQEIPELDYLESVSKTGTSIIFVHIRQNFTDMRPIWDDMRRKVDRVARELPDGAIGPMVNDEYGDVFGVVIGLTGEGYNPAELKDVADEVRDDLLALADSAKVDIYGVQAERVFVEMDNSRLSELGITPPQLLGALAAQNIINPGGSVFTERERFAIEPTGNFESIEDLRQAVIVLAESGQVLALGDVAKVYRGYADPPDSYFHDTGSRGLALAVSMREGGDIIALGEQVRALMDELSGVYPIGIEFNVIAFEPDRVADQVNSFVINLLEAIGIVVAVMLISLGIRTGLVVAALIPMAMVMAILVMHLFGIGLDQVSIASLIIALGMLVDNATVMSESIMVEMNEGKSPVDAAVDSASELRIPLLTSSLTTAAAFLPIFLAESETGEYTASIFKVVTITLLSSWVLALTMTPLLCVKFLKKKDVAGGIDGNDSYDTPGYRRYRAFLLTLLRHRVLTVSVAFALFAFAIFGLRFVPVIFFPPSDDPIILAELEMPRYTPIETMETIILDIEKIMVEDDDINDWGTFIGNGGPRFVVNHSPEIGTPAYAFMIVNAASTEVLPGVMARMETTIAENHPDMATNIRPRSLGPPVQYPVVVRITGDDRDVLLGHADTIRKKLRTIEGVKEVSDDWGSWTKKLVVDVNQPRARRAGITSQDVAFSLQASLSGVIATDFREGEQLIPVTLRSSSPERRDIGRIETLEVYSRSTGRGVPLKQVADVDVVWEPSQILRRNRVRAIEVRATLDDGVIARQVTDVLSPWLEGETADWSRKFSYELGGEASEQASANASITKKLPIAAMIIVFLLVLQFNSIRRPLIILVTIPLGVIGVVIGLLTAQSYFGFMTLLGIISLAGIVLNNAIVLLERINIEQTEFGREPADAVIEAAQRRLRPILLTTYTTIGGLLPLWFLSGPMWEPMAIAIIFGLAFSTVLTLGVVPALYSLLYRVDYRDYT